ncbi:unnamed protein product, partial [Rotaria socialis]
MNKKSNEAWACKFAKVKGVEIDLDKLVSRIKTDHKIQKKVEEPLSINIFTASADSGTSTMEVNGEFVFSQILINCLLRLKSTQLDTKELINHCKNEYEGNQIELSNISEFQQDYSPKKVLRCTDYWKALAFLDLSDASGDLERILFEINADPKIVTTKPFADISKHSEFSDEAEVLFMIGSIFRLKSIKRDENQVWI